MLDALTDCGVDLDSIAVILALISSLLALTSSLLALRASSFSMRWASISGESPPCWPRSLPGGILNDRMAQQKDRSDMAPRR